MILLISLADNPGLDDKKLHDFGPNEMQTQEKAPRRFPTELRDTGGPRHGQ